MTNTPFQLPIVKVEPNESVSVSFAAPGSGITLEFASISEAVLTFDAIVFSLNRQAMAVFRGER